jgi:hypothetical protein
MSLGLILIIILIIFLLDLGLGLACEIQAGCAGAAGDRPCPLSAPRQRFTGSNPKVGAVERG